uniref:RxLR effector candidate protein n=1 Tax=Hyaloperonospora arabidopsidis (strain Emoy2) TaxID=559515 RepID=M4BCR8_HYAAE
MRFVSRVCLALATIAVTSTSTSGAEKRNLSGDVKSDHDPSAEDRRGGGGGVRGFRFGKVPTQPSALNFWFIYPYDTPHLDEAIKKQQFILWARAKAKKYRETHPN